MTVRWPRAAHLGKPAVPKEDVEQRRVCEFLDKLGVLYCAIPNGGKRRRVEAAIMKGLGTKKGAPDLLIFKAPRLWFPWWPQRGGLNEDRHIGYFPVSPHGDPDVPDWQRGRPWPLRHEQPPEGGGGLVSAHPVGVAVEMKKQGATLSDITPEQREWGIRLSRAGWYWFAARGADEAIDELRRLGFGREGT